jgi:hypothetical protein
MLSSFIDLSDVAREFVLLNPAREDAFPDQHDTTVAEIPSANTSRPGHRVGTYTTRH